MSHAFTIPAYGRSSHLTACLDSILRQSRSDSEVVMSTSTPSNFLEKIAKEYRIPLLVNPVREGIGADWNFALTSTDAQFVTIAHQDDRYERDYTALMLDAIRRHPNAVIAYSNSTEHTPAGPRNININLRVKRALSNRAYRADEALEHPPEKRRLLTLGNPVCCPSVVINRGLAPDFRFTNSMKSNLDWEAWSRLALSSGAFVYVRTALVSKCVHADSETSTLIANRLREKEDRQMFDRFWPSPVAAALSIMYKLSYRANRQ